MKKAEWFNLPNALTSLRIVLGPLLALLFFRADPQMRAELGLLLVAAGLTDCLDGFLARRLHQVTTLGKVLDPIADKVLGASILFCLCFEGLISYILLAIVVALDLFMAAGAAYCLKHRLEVSADILGKIGTLMFYPAVILAWPWHSQVNFTRIGVALLYLSTAVSVAASVHYTIESVKKLKASSLH